MFNKKPETKQNPELDTQLNHDLLVHNMPSSDRLRGASLHQKNRSITVGFKTSKASSDSQKKSKTMGIIIIIGGLIFIIGLVVFFYLFIVKSTVRQKLIHKSAAVKIVNNPSSQITVSASSSLAHSTGSSLATNTNQNSIKSLINKKVVKTTVVNVPITKTSVGTSSPTTNKLPPLLDSDHDGLNNLEELVLGTSATSSDTNHNGYPDLTEVENNYNPIGTGRLNADPNLSTYHNQAFDYQLLYPQTWPQQSINNGASIIFTAPDGSLIQVSVQANSREVSISNWYQALFPNLKISQNSLKKTAGWSGIMGQNNLNFYLTNKKRTQIFVISYIPAVAGRLVYPHIFQLMINSLIIK